MNTDEIYTGDERVFRTTSQDKKGVLQKKYASIVSVAKTEGFSLDKYKTISEAIKEWIKDPFDLSELTEGVEGGLEGASDVEDIQKAFNKQVTKLLYRYLSAEKREKRNIFLAKRRFFEMGEETYYQAPDAIVVDKNKRVIETIRYKSKAATGLMKGLNTIKDEFDFEMIEKFYDLYADHQYVKQNIREIAPEFEDSNPFSIECNYYFMKKTTDKAGKFDLDFFGGSGNSIVGFKTNGHILMDAGVCKENAPVLTRPKKDGGTIEYSLDMLFEKYVETATTVGFDCNKDNCKYCAYNVQCNYQKARKKLEKGDNNSPAKLDMTTVKLSDAQLAVVDAATNGAASVYLKLVDEFKDSEDELKKNMQAKVEEAKQMAADAISQYIKVNAGAGSGKTFTMTYLVWFLVKVLDYSLDEILVTSFTDAGVAELRGRIAKALEDMAIAPADVRAYTFDSLYYMCVKENAERLGFPEIPKLLTKEWQREYVEDLLRENTIPNIDYAKIKYDAKSGNSTAWVITAVAKAFDLIQTFHIYGEPDAEDQLIDKLTEAGLMHSMDNNSVKKILEIYKEFDARLKAENMITFSHLQGLMNQLLQLDPDYLKNLGFKYIIVDEFQDTNEYQIGTLNEFISAEQFEKLIVVGDDAQAIYSFRDTTPEYIINLDKYIGHEVLNLYLLENRRSTPEIINLANGVIQLNQNRVLKDLIPVREHGEKVVVKGFQKVNRMYDNEIEREWIAKQIIEMVQSGKYQPNEIAVIGRKRSDAASVGTLLSEAGIPWVSKNPMNLLENSKVQSALALSDAFYDPEDDMSYFAYLVSAYDGKLMDADPAEIRGKINDLKNIFMTINEYEFEDQQKIFHGLLEELKKVEEDEIYSYFLDLLYANEDLPSELAYTRVFKKYGDAMEKKMDQSYEGVVLVTAHSSKGLEWPVCFVMTSSWDSEKLHKRGKKVEAELEEARRLLFVALTRARDELYVTGEYVAFGSEEKVGANGVTGGYVYNQFLHEIFVLLDEKWDPTDYKKIEAKLQKEKEAMEAKLARKAKQNAAKAHRAGTMTEEQKREYDRMVLGARQQTFNFD